MDVPPLASVGRRICVFGPSNAGKSSLAVALADKLGIPAVHLDLLHHQPHTDWVPRPRGEFIALHDAAVAGDSWVMEGNYMALLDSRIARATGIVLLGTDRWTALGRYLRRTLFETRRLGVPAGTRDRLNRKMMRFILLEQPQKRRRDIALLEGTGLPLVQLKTMSDLQRLYEAWGLQRI